MFEQRRLLEDKVSDETVKILRLVILLLLSGFASTSFSADLSSAMTLSFVMDDQQKKTLDEYSKYASDGRFSVSVEIDGHSSLIPATVHLRGQGSRVLCDRKSFTVNFSGDFNHTLIRNSDSKGYYLLSMCQDRLFLRTLSMFRIWKEQGLFPLAFRYVELKFNNESRGLYILLEKPVSGLLRQYPALTSVLRRGFFTNTDSTRVVYTTSTANIATGDYVRSFQDLDYLSEEDQISRLTEVLDLDQYLRHLAVAAIVRNGDYVDELYFYRVAGENQLHKIAMFLGSWVGIPKTFLRNVTGEENMRSRTNGVLRTVSNPVWES